jgi:uncharacterized Zn finger protein
MEEYQCPECGSQEQPNVSKMKHGADADGNRYEWWTCIECVECGYEYAI